MSGGEDAYIVIHKFADYRCSHCFNTSLLLQNAMRRWPGRIRVYYRQFPLDGTCNDQVRRKQPDAQSCNGAQAAICAPDQGKDFFPRFNYSLYDFQRSRSNITLTNLEHLVNNLGGDWAQMRSCMASQETSQSLERDIKDAIVVNVQSTPTLVVQDRLLPAGTPDRNYFYQLMDAFVFEKEGQSAYDEFMERVRKAKKP